MTHEHDQERVARGSALLDRRLPGWYKKIHVHQLNMRVAEDCVIGQLTGSFYQRHKLLGFRVRWLVPGATRFLVNRGFYVKTRNASSAVEVFRTMSEYNELTHLWREEIVKRRLSTSSHVVAARKSSAT